MEGLVTLLIYAALIYFMMRFGCGAHMIHGHGSHKHEDHNDAGDLLFVDPVCGKDVQADQGYGVMHKGNLYRFCSRKCLDQFDTQPSLFIHNIKHLEEGHEH